jgi:hypothetical protein
MKAKICSFIKAGDKRGWNIVNIIRMTNVAMNPSASCVGEPLRESTRNQHHENKANGLALEAVDNEE